MRAADGRECFSYRAVGTMMGALLCSVGLIAWFSAHAQVPADYPWHCEPGDVCPVRYVVHGFDVRVSPTIYDHPNFSHEILGRDIDHIGAQLLQIQSFNGLPKPAIQALINTGVSIYLDASNPYWDDWWPCERMMRTDGCYHSATNRIGIHVVSPYYPFPNFAGGVTALDNWSGSNHVVLHELAHAYHAKVLPGGDKNVCIARRFQASRHLYTNVEQSEQFRFRETEIPIHERQSWDQYNYKIGYVTVNAFEWFANLSQAMFATAEEQPFNRNEFWRMDRESYLLIWNAWHDPDGFCP